MATAPSHADSSVQPTTAMDWSSLRYDNATVSIRDSIVIFSEDESNVHKDGEIRMRVWFHVSTFIPTSPWPPLLMRRDRHSTFIDLTMSQLAHVLRARIPNDVFRGLELHDVDDYADFLVDSVGLFTQDYVHHFFATHDRALQVYLIEIEVHVHMVDTGVPRPQLRKVTYEEEEGEGSPAVQETKCPICLEDFVIGEQVDVTPCGHPFHPNCLDRWLEKETLCPLCRNLFP